MGYVGGICVGEGLPPVPEKLAARIRRGEFVEMCELLPEYWLAKEEDGVVKAEKQRPRRVLDISTWVQSFTIYVSVRAAHDPALIPELMAYMYTIVRASQDFGGTSWVNYDTVFRRQAAATGMTAWSRVNGTLHHICFNGPRRQALRCDLCLAATHRTEDCVLGDPEQDSLSRLRTLEAMVRSLTSRQTTNHPQASVNNPQAPPIRPSGEVCRAWNRQECHFRRCRHTHICSNCGGNHPAVLCRAPSQIPQGRSGWFKPY